MNYAPQQSDSFVSGRQRKGVRAITVGFVALVPTLFFGAAPAQADDTNGTNSCPTREYYSTPSRVSGWKGTTETSYQTAGPASINTTETSTATQTFGAGVTFSVSANAIVAKAEAAFNANYSYSTASSKSWGYSTTIPAGRTGLMAVLHRNDRVSTVKYLDTPQCTTTTSSTFYSYVPLAATSNADYCIIRDLTPYGYSNWREKCVGE